MAIITTCFLLILLLHLLLLLLLLHLLEDEDRRLQLQRGSEHTPRASACRVRWKELVMAMLLMTMRMVLLVVVAIQMTFPVLLLNYSTPREKEESREGGSVWEVPLLIGQELKFRARTKWRELVMTMLLTLMRVRLLLLLLLVVVAIAMTAGMKTTAVKSLLHWQAST